MVHSEPNISFIVKNGTSNGKGEVIHNKNSRRNKIKLNRSQYEETIILWSLSKFLGMKEYNGIDFTYIFSTPQLPNGLSYEPFLSLLNSKKVFENHVPKENDCVKIWLEYIHPENNRRSRPYIKNFISFIYTHEWTLNSGLDHTDYDYETICEGEIRIS